MARKPADTRNFTLRIRETLGRRLEREAEKHQTSLNNEIRLRLEDSFQVQARREIEDIAANLNIVNAKLTQTVTLPPLEEKLAQALAQGDFEKAKPLASAWLEKRAAAKKIEEEGSSS
jgi:hypothetical protein